MKTILPSHFTGYFGWIVVFAFFFMVSSAVITYLLVFTTKVDANKKKTIIDFFLYFGGGLMACFLLSAISAHVFYLPMANQLGGNFQGIGTLAHEIYYYRPFRSYFARSLSLLVLLFMSVLFARLKLCKSSTAKEK